jgi:hypothetical protein
MGKFLDQIIRSINKILLFTEAFPGAEAVCLRIKTNRQINFLEPCFETRFPLISVFIPA